MTRAHRFVVAMQAMTLDASYLARIRAVVIASATPEECVPRDLIRSAYELVDYLERIAGEEGVLDPTSYPAPTWLAVLLEREGQTLQQFIDNA